MTDAEAEIQRHHGEVLELIRLSHLKPENDAIQQEALEKALSYLQTNAKDHHFFCDPIMYQVSIHILILFSFGDNEPLQWFKEQISRSLNTCAKCVTCFHRGRAELKKTFIVQRGVSIASVEQFSNLILDWEAQRLLQRLTDFHTTYSLSKVQNPQTSVPIEILYGIAECLSGPGMLRLNQQLRQLFDQILYSLLASDHVFVQKYNAIAPGLIFFLFEGQDAQKNWAFQQLNTLYTPESLIPETQLYPDILEEFQIHFLNIQNPQKFTSNKCELFYRNVFSIFRMFDKDAILNKLALSLDKKLFEDVVPYEVLPFFTMLQKHIMGYLNEPLPYILRFFKLILEKIGDKYWPSVTPYTYQNILETITGSPHFLQNLNILEILALPNGEVDPIARISDLLDWIDEFLKSLDSSKQQTTYNRLSLFFIELVESQNSIPLHTKAILFKKACQMTSASLTIPSKLYTPTFKTDLLLRSDSKMVVSTKLVRFMDYATSRAIFYPEKDRAGNGEVCKLAVLVISRALRFDVLNLAQSTYDIHNGKPASTLKFSSDMFRLILKQNFRLQLELAYQLLISLENVSNIIPLSGQQKIEADEFLGYVKQFFVKLSDIDSVNIKMILSNSRSLKGYWASIFSSNTGVYQSAVDILYETFEADGRLEGIHSLLDNNLDSCLTAINENLTNLVFFKAFEPCPGAVRVLIDVLSALNSPINGLFRKSDMFTTGVKETLKVFWNRCWLFLDLIYVQTLVWANQALDLVEFTRDTLDLSHSVLQCFHEINEFFKGDTKQTFAEITNTFPDMLVWLRLSDAGLLSSCVKLISSTVDLATQFNLTLDTNVITLLAKYGSRAKKFNNKLTEQQSNEILMRAKVFDKKLVESIFEESENYRKSKLQASASASASSSEATPAPKGIRYEDIGDDIEVISADQMPPHKPRNQLKIDKFGSLSRVPPRVAAKPKLPMTALEKARAEIKARTIHPPGQLGFNPRKKTVKKSEDDSSEDDDDDGDDFHGLFGLPKPQATPGIILLDDKLKKPRSRINEQQREEEYSRNRLNVDLKPLYRKVLRWSFRRDDEFPDSEYNEIKPVADVFNSALDYIRTYEPLLLLECWQAILSAKKREADKPMYVTVGSKSTVDDFFEIYISMTRSEIQDRNLGDSDLVVLAVSANATSVTGPKIREVKESKVSCLGKIHEIKNVKGDKADVTIRVTRSADLNNFLTPQSVIIMMRIMQMTTIEREYSSLFGLEYYNLSKQIFEAKADTSSKCDESELETIQKIYNVNESQARAIGVSFNTSGFSLIQGPPGTGKTKTIIGIIGYMLSSFHSSNAISVPLKDSGFSTEKKRKILVCAPSNAAVDELVLRLKDGLMDSKGVKYAPQLVRLGRTDAINTAVKDMTLEELVDVQLGKMTPITNNMESYNKELRALQSQIAELKAQIEDTKNPAGDDVYKKRRELIQKANGVKMKKDQERESINSQYRNRDINRRNLQAKILAGAEIICATLSGSAHDMVANMGIKFDSVIIDEACQCTELSAVIPLRYGCNRCIMVGDPNQLPPTVLSGAAANSGYDQSLFVRMAKNAKPLLLDVQYRMNSAISKFPSKMFYDGALKDGLDNDKLTERPWHEDALFKPYTFFDIIEGIQSQNAKTMSYTNHVEVEIAIELVSKLLEKYRRYNFKNKIGIITPYKEQNRLLHTSFVREFGKSINNEISFNTIDGFQGQEKEIIIMSCVRADPVKKGIGFLKDFRRMNVALTRPKCSLWILGNHDSLVTNDLWSNLINDAKSRNLLIEARRGFSRGGVNNTPKNTSDPGRQPQSGNFQKNAEGQDPSKSKKKKKKKEKKTPFEQVVNLSTTSVPNRSGSLPPPPSLNSRSTMIETNKAQHPSVTVAPSISTKPDVQATTMSYNSSSPAAAPPFINGIITTPLSGSSPINNAPGVPVPAYLSNIPSAQPPNVLPTSINPSPGPSGTNTIPENTLNPTRSGNLPSIPPTNTPSSSNEVLAASRTGSLPPRPDDGQRPKKKRPKESSLFIQRKKKKHP